MGLSRRWTVAGVVVAVLGLAVPAWAHGGYYTGPKTPDGIPLPADGPGTGGPTTDPNNPPPYGPAVTGRKGPEETTPGTRALPPVLLEPPIRGTQWEHWWATYKSRYLLLALERGRPRPAPGATSGDGPGARRKVNAGALAISFRSALGADSPDVRAAAALALGRMRVLDARPRLHALAAEDASPDVRVSAALALLTMADEEDLPSLDMLLADRKQRVTVRCVAALAIGRIGGDDAAASLRGALPSKRATNKRTAPALVATVYYALGFTGSDVARGPIRAGIGAKNRNNRDKGVVRSFAELSAGRLGDREALARLLINLQNSRDISMRRSAALGAGMLARPDDREVLALLLGLAKASGEPGLRRFCALALGGVRSGEVRGRLETAFRAAKPLDRPFLAIALALQGDPSSGALLREAFKADRFEESLRGAYAISLGILGDARAAKLLEEELGRQDRRWSPGYAALALAMMGSDGSRELIHERLVKSKDRRLQTTLTVALGLLGDPRAEERLAERLARAGTIHARATAAIALGWLRSRAALPALSRLARDNSGSEPAILRAAAITAVGRILAPAGPSPLLEVLEGHNFSIELPPLMEVADALNQR